MIKYDVYTLLGWRYRVRMDLPMWRLSEYYNPYLGVFHTSGISAAHVVLHAKAVLVARNVVFKDSLCSQ